MIVVANYDAKLQSLQNETVVIGVDDDNKIILPKQDFKTKLIVNKENKEDVITQGNLQLFNHLLLSSNIEKDVVVDSNIDEDVTLEGNTVTFELVNPEDILVKDVTISNQAYSIDMIIHNLIQRDYLSFKNIMYLDLDVEKIDMLKQVEMDGKFYLSVDEIDKLYAKVYSESQNDMILDSSVIETLLVPVSGNGIGMILNSDVESSVVKLRLLRDMDSSSLSDFDNMTLSSVYYIEV